MTEVAKMYKVSEQTIYGWRKHFAGLEPQDIKRLKILVTENAKPKKLLAERELEVDLMRETNRKKVVSPQARREQGGLLCKNGPPRRRV